MWFQVGVILLCLLLSAFFSGMEIAYVSANKIHLEIEKKQQTFTSKILGKLTEKPSQFIASMLVGNNIVLVIYGILMGEFLVSWIAGNFPDITSGISLFLQVLLSTLVILFTAEFLPKVFFQIYANKLVKIMAFPAYVFYWLFTPISWGVMGVSNVVLKYFFKTDGDQESLTFSKTELGDYINQQVGTITDEEELDSEIQIFQNALEFSGVRVREVMVPRTEMVSVDRRQSISEVAKLIQVTGLSKILVYNNTIDDIIGYVHAFELFKSPKSLSVVIRPVFFVPETMYIKDVLNSLTKKRKSLAVVVDEYGGTSGLVTVEDIIEELFGEIEDEHDSVMLIEEQISEDEFLFSARIEVDHINEVYNLNIPESESYETLGGFIVNFTEEIPKANEVIVIEHFQITIKETLENKIILTALKVMSS
ncbi:hemolysin family protein [Aquimarina agarilytica]|uniref:hemolysin family protein n=1 Tax=Aquimarina agarilytica TaxID=1087449 RepID=UPI00028A1C81|nr:hemolysin family protein [Aquimarina agarilytica]